MRAARAFCSVHWSASFGGGRACLGRSVACPRRQARKALHPWPLPFQALGGDLAIHACLNHVNLKFSDKFGRLDSRLVRVRKWLLEVLRGYYVLRWTQE